MIIRFQEVKAWRTKVGHCPSCGRITNRRRIFTQTVSPYNRNEDGSVKTPEEVRKAVNAEAEAWVPDFTHNTEKCRTQKGHTK